ncbi:MAG: adenylosuccinate synthetase, partial [Gammaproteobacteria bacterium]
TLGARSLDQLPAAAQNYLRHLESIVGIPVDMVSTGADRDHNIILRHPFD